MVQYGTCYSGLHQVTLRHVVPQRVSLGHAGPQRVSLSHVGLQRVHFRSLWATFEGSCFHPHRTPPAQAGLPPSDLDERQGASIGVGVFFGVFALFVLAAHAVALGLSRPEDTCGVRGQGGGGGADSKRPKAALGEKQAPCDK